MKCTSIMPVKYEVSTLSGSLLDACVDRSFLQMKGYPQQGVVDPHSFLCRSYSTDWAFGGPLIAKYSVSLSRRISDGIWEAACWDKVEGETALIAAMRAIVLNQFGPTVNILTTIESEE